LDDFSCERQACVSATRTGSCGIEQVPLAHDGGRERCPEMKAAVKLLARPHKNIGGDADAPEEAVRGLRQSVAGLVGLRHDHHQVIVAVRTGFAARHRAKEVDALRLECLTQAFDNFCQLGVVVQQRLMNSGHGFWETGFSSASSRRRTRQQGVSNDDGCQVLGSSSPVEGEKRREQNLHRESDVNALFNQRGVTYLGVMVVIVLMGISMTVVGKQWTVVVKRDKEAELLFRGNRIKAAIEWYVADYQVRKGTRPNQYPLRLTQLVEGPKRYLPVVYKDPITGQDFDLIKIGAEIQGVKSRSAEAPMDQVRFKQAGQYRDILFIAEKPGANNGCVPVTNPINPLVSTTCPQAGAAPTGAPAAQSASGDPALRSS